MRQPTVDPGVFIEQRDKETVYYVTTAGEHWVIRGACNRCGECEVGANNKWVMWIPRKKVGEPGACFDFSVFWRLDVPVRPEGVNVFWPHCSLTGEYLPSDEGEHVDGH